MNIQYLGTAAAEGIPALFCRCNVCKEARKRGGRNIRTRSQAIVDGKILIDFPADTYMHILNNNIDLADIKHCLITHTHDDHLYPQDINMRAPGFSNLSPDEAPIIFYGSLGTAKKINGCVSGAIIDPKGIVETKILNLYSPENIAGYTVTAMPAIHDPLSSPVIYLIKDPEGKALLYAHDTHYFAEEVWAYIEKEKIKLSFVSLDCTSANVPEMTYIGHMNLNDNIKVRQRLQKIGAADHNTLFCLNHFSHNGDDVLYDDFSKIAEKEGFLTSYDGMEIEF